MDQTLNLRERTVLIAGPFSSTVQNVMMGLTQLGADVAILDSEANKAAKFCQNILDQREVNEKAGRAIAIQADLSKAADVKEAVGRVAQTFGGLDVYLDAHLLNTPTAMALTGDTTDIAPILDFNLKIPLMLTQNIIGYLKGRKRGRIIYLLNQATMNRSTADLYATAARTGLVQFSQSLAKFALDSNVMVNTLSIGMTEEFLVGHFPESPSIKDALEKMKAIDPFVRITEPDRITNSIVYLASQFGNAVTGQTLSLY